MNDAILTDQPAFDDYQEANKILASIPFEMGDDAFFDYFPNTTRLLHFYWNHVLLRTPFDSSKHELVFYEIEQAEEILPFALVKRLLTRILELTPLVTIVCPDYPSYDEEIEVMESWGIPLERLVRVTPP